MDVIAQAAGVSRPTLYQYYRGKEEIFRAGIRWGLDDLAERAESEARMPGATTERLTAVLSVVLRMHDTRGGDTGRFRAELIDETFARAADLWAAFEERLLAVVRTILEQAGAGFSAPGVTTAEAAAVLLYGTKGLALHGGDRDEREALLRHFVILTARGLGDHITATT